MVVVRRGRNGGGWICIFCFLELGAVGATSRSWERGHSDRWEVVEHCFLAAYNHCTAFQGSSDVWHITVSRCQYKHIVLIKNYNHTLILNFIIPLNSLDLSPRPSSRLLQSLDQ